MLTAILTYLATNKIVLVGATATVCEIAVIVINTYRKIKSGEEGVKKSSRKSLSKIFLWSANPVNLFRKA